MNTQWVFNLIYDIWFPNRCVTIGYFNCLTCIIHHCDVIMGVIGSQITSLTVVYSTVHWGPGQRKHQSITGLCAWNSPVTGEFPAQLASNAENVSIWWRHDVFAYLFIYSVSHSWIFWPCALRIIDGQRRIARDCCQPIVPGQTHRWRYTGVTHVLNEL